MMDVLRGEKMSFVWKAIAIVVPVSFVIGGMSGYLVSGTDTFAAKVNGEEISQRTFQQSYTEEYRAASERLGDQFVAVAESPEFVDSLRKNVLNRLIDQQLLTQYIKDLNLDVGDEQIKRAIVNTPSLQTDGKFDNSRYQQLLTANGITADTYAGYVRQDLRQNQLLNALLGTEFVVPAQQQQLAEAFFQVRQVQLAELSLQTEIVNQTVTEQEAKDYYEANKSAFLVPELVKVQYLNLDRKNIEGRINVTDVEIAQYYQDNKNLFMQQHLAHIQLSDENQANQVYQALQNGGDFAELAKINSQDKPSAANGGDLSWLPAGALPPTFEMAANNLAVGQYSQPVKVDNTYHIIKVLERKERPFDQVKTDIATAVKNDLFSNEFFKVEKQADQQAYEDQSGLNSAATASGIELLETDYFSRNDVPKALNYPNVVSQIFSDNLVNGGANSNAINVGEHHSILFRVIEHKAEGTRSFEEAKADIETFLKRQKAEATVLAKATEMVKALNENANDIPAGVQFSSEQGFTYATAQDPQLANSIFAMSKPQDGKPTFQAIQSSSGNIVIARLNKVEQPAIDEADLNNFGAQLNGLQQMDAQNLLLQALRQKAKVELNETFINQVQE